MGKLAPPMVLGHWLAALAMALGPTGGAGYDVGDRPFRQTGTTCPGGMGGWGGCSPARCSPAQGRAGPAQGVTHRSQRVRARACGMRRRRLQGVGLGARLPSTEKRVTRGGLWGTLTRQRDPTNLLTHPAQLSGRFLLPQCSGELTLAANRPAGGLRVPFKRLVGAGITRRRLSVHVPQQRHGQPRTGNRPREPQGATTAASACEWTDGRTASMPTPARLAPIPSRIERPS